MMAVAPHSEKPLVISFIIPAHNEEELLGRTLTALHAATRSTGEPYEVIVVNDSSADRTGDIARSHDARVVDVTHRQIAATRNAGARAATGEWFIFVDADTMVTERAVRAALRVLRNGAVGGGCLARFDGPVPFYGRVLERLVLPLVLPLFGLAAGCFFFCRRDTFFAAGGFDESLYATEEVALGQRLKQLGRFVIVRESVITSGRKVRSHSAWGMLRVGLRLALGGPKALQRREGLDYWYGQRTNDTVVSGDANGVPARPVA